MSRKKIAVTAICSAAAIFVVLTAAVAIGSVFIPPKEIFGIVSNAFFRTPLDGRISANTVSIIMSVRMPRVVLAFLVGAALSVSGAVVQSVLRNPLASPFTLGTSSGASLGASVVIAAEISLFGSFTLAFSGLAFSVLTMFVMIAFARRLDKTLQSSTVVLTGMVLSLFISAVVTMIANIQDEKYKQIMKWQTGSFTGRGWEYTAILAVVLVVCTAVALTFSKELDILTFGDEQAQSAGVNSKKVRVLLLVVSAVLSGTAVAFAGVIGFADLISPHIARRLFGARHRILLPMSAVTGGIFMVVCDLIARVAIIPNELPVGVVTSLVGAPFFAYVFFRRRTSKERGVR